MVFVKDIEFAAWLPALLAFSKIISLWRGFQLVDNSIIEAYRNAICNVNIQRNRTQYVHKNKRNLGAFFVKFHLKKTIIAKFDFKTSLVLDNFYLYLQFIRLRFIFILEDFQTDRRTNSSICLSILPIERLLLCCAGAQADNPGGGG